MDFVEELLWPVLGVAVFSLPLLAFALPILAMRRWRGAWRKLAFAALLPICQDIVRIVTGLIADPTSHNLFPLELVAWSVPGLLFFFLLWLIRLALRPRSGTAWGPGVCNHNC
jgi:hypothetical protein